MLLWPVFAWGQETIPTILGRAIGMVGPAVDAGGQRVLIGSAIAPDGTNGLPADLYIVMADGTGLRRLTRLPQGASAASLAEDGSRAAYTRLASGSEAGGEEVHVLDVASGADRTVALDTAGCIQPQCPNCFLSCVHSPHMTPDGSKVLYLGRRQQPFYVVNADGTGWTRLPVSSGGLAPAPQRVISRNGTVVFTSNAVAGPAFGPSAVDVYLMNLDGSSVRALTRFGNDPTVVSHQAVISGDGGVIAFESNRDPETGSAGRLWRVWVVRSDGTGLRALTAGSEASATPSISGNGSQVALVEDGQIRVARSDGGGAVVVAGFQMSAAQDPVISEDGSRVVFGIRPWGAAGGSGAIWAVNSDGRSLRAVYAPRSLSQGGVTGIDYSSPSPGSLFTAYGTNLAVDALTPATRLPLPESLGGVSLRVNGRPVPLLAVTPWQVNGQLPPDLGEGPVTFQLRFFDGAMPAPAAAELKAVAPAIFSGLSGGACQAAVLHGGASKLVDAANPAEAGETIEIYGTGLGPVIPFVPAGIPSPGFPLAQSFRPEVLIGGRPAAVRFAGLAPGMIGVYQVNAVVPPGLRPGRQFVAWRLGTVSSSGCGTIGVR